MLRLQELGWVLERDFGGRASNMATMAAGSAVALVRLIIEKLQGFRDTVVYKGGLCHFYKRAQILTSDLWAAYGRQVDSEHFASFHDMGTSPVRRSTPAHCTDSTPPPREHECEHYS